MTAVGSILQDGMTDVRTNIRKILQPKRCFAVFFYLCKFENPSFQTVIRQYFYNRMLRNNMPKEPRQKHLCNFDTAHHRRCRLSSIS